MQTEIATLPLYSCRPKKSSTGLEAWTVVGNVEAVPNMFALN